MNSVQSPLRHWKCFLVVIAMMLITRYAQGSVTVLVGEPFGSFGTMMPLGHTAVYLDHLCADGPLHVRPCLPHEPQGVILARYHAIGPYDWLATPILDFLYATQDVSEIPAAADPETIWAMRERYRERFLQYIVPNGKQGVMARDGSAHHARDVDEWWETAGMAYYRRLWAYQVDSTPEQDAHLLLVMNGRLNRHRYHLNGANCADFAAEILNLYYPGSVVRADRIADYGLMTPKHVVRSLSGFAALHENVHLRVWAIAQVPGSLRRSRPVWGGVESALKTKRYLFTLVLIQPEIPLVLEALYLRHGRWKIGEGAEIMPLVPSWQRPDVVATALTDALSAGLSK